MKRFLGLLFCGAVLFAHPMGNFSVSHFSKLQLTDHGIDLRYVLDLAEIPTFELLRTWKIDRSASPQELNARARQQAQEWLNHLSITANGHVMKAPLESVKATIVDGAGNLPILRADMRAHIETTGGSLRYEDGNYPERAGWKEIVIAGAAGVSLVKVSQSDHDLSKALTEYPPDPTVAPPQDLRAQLEWKTAAPHVVSNKASVRAPAPAVTSIAQPRQSPAAPAPATLTAQGAPAGAVVRGDFLSRLLHQRELSLPMMLLALAAAFGLGAAHAFTPGHGKTIVAAYLVGSRGTLKHAAFLGAMVTFTHTVVVFVLGLATLFLFRFIVPEKITVFLGAISGMAIVVLGAIMFDQRLRSAANAHIHAHSHDHDGHAHVHLPGGEHSHLHEPMHAHSGPHDHSHVHHHHGPGVLEHSHGSGTHTHSHVPADLSWGGLVALGASGGLVPCESALVLLLGAIALGRVGLGLLLLVSFSLGLAVVLMLIGVLVLYAKNLLPERARSGGHPFFRWVSIASPAVVMIVGLLMTAASLGWIQAKWMVG